MAQREERWVRSMVDTVPATADAIALAGGRGSTIRLWIRLGHMVQDASGIVAVSQVELAEKSGLSIKTVQTETQWLTDHKFVYREHFKGGGRRWRYAINPACFTAGKKDGKLPAFTQRAIKDVEEGAPSPEGAVQKKAPAESGAARRQKAYRERLKAKKGAAIAAKVATEVAAIEAELDKAEGRERVA